MVLLTILFYLNTTFASFISFTDEQCERFKTEGITGGDIFINEALARDCGIHKQEDKTHFQPMVLTNSESQKKDCNIKNMALNANNTGYFQDVVVFNNLEKIEPDKNNEYPWVMKLFTPANDGTGNYRPSNAVSIAISSMPECESHLNEVFGDKINSKNLIFTTAHSLYGADNCNILSDNKSSEIHIFTGEDMSRPSGKIEINGFACAEYECDKVRRNIHNDICVLFPDNEPKFSSQYKAFNSTSNREYKLIAFQDKLSRFTNRFTEHQRVISSSSKKPELKNVYSKKHKPYEALYIYMDAEGGASGGAISNSPEFISAIFAESSENKPVSDDKYRKGYENGVYNNYALDIKKACLNLRAR